MEVFLGPKQRIGRVRVHAFLLYFAGVQVCLQFRTATGPGQSMMGNQIVETSFQTTRVTDVGTRSYVLQRQWFPMYVTYSRELDVQKALDAEGVQNYIPMVNVTEKRGKKIVHSQRPALHNLIFVYSDRTQLRELKMFNKACVPMQFMTVKARTSDQASVVITIPEAQMQNFMKAMAVENGEDKRTFLSYTDFLGREGRNVEFISGPFKGVTGTLKRINKNRFVVIVLQHIGALAITIDHSTDLRILE